MDEQYYERLLNIKTCGKQDLDETSAHYNRYEPTEYLSLEKLFDKYKLKETDQVVDFGCGKGRLNFYINYKFKAKITGIEMNTYFYKQALSNKESYLKMHKENKEKINFICCLAEKYEIDKNDNKFYFFNPFSVQIFMKVIDNIIGSVYENSRQIELILFYPSDEYIFFLEQYTFFKLKEEIKLDNFYNDSRDRFLIYELAYI